MVVVKSSIKKREARARQALERVQSFGDSIDMSLGNAAAVLGAAMHRTTTPRREMAQVLLITASKASLKLRGHLVSLFWYHFLCVIRDVQKPVLVPQYHSTAMGQFLYIPMCDTKIWPLTQLFHFAPLCCLMLPVCM